MTCTELVNKIRGYSSHDVYIADGNCFREVTGIHTEQASDGSGPFMFVVVEAKPGEGKEVQREEKT